MTRLSDRINRLSLSQTQKFHTKAQELKQRRDDVIDLGAGQPDFSEPHRLLETTDEELYSRSQRPDPVEGMEKLREAIGERYGQLYDREVSSNQVIITHGAKAALYQACQVLFAPGDEVLIPNPGWVSYKAQIKMAGAVPKPIQGDATNHYLPTASELEKGLTDDTQGLILNSPCNPTGGMYKAEQRKGILDFAEKKGLVTISDECYDGFSYDIPASTFWEEGRDDIVVIGSASKNFSMTGWRIGYCIGVEKFVKAMRKFQSAFMGGTCALAQRGVWQALEETKTLPGHIREEFRNRRDYLANALSEIPGVKSRRPPGAFYLFPDVNGILAQNSDLKEDEDLAMYLLNRARIVTIPGSAFGLSGHLRIAYVRNMEQLKEAVDRIHSAFKALVT